MTRTFLYPFVIFCIPLYCQDRESVADTLQEVVVTGQIEPQSLKKSVHNVRIISRADIKQLAANNIADVLNQYLNISIRTSGNDGRSTVSMFGLDSQYFKVLVDNVPLVSETGLGTNIDLTQVNLDDIEQIEIIEGSMGVTHGANAVTGILNIITKKKSAYSWEISATAQEETIADEFAFFDRGRHIQSVKISHNFANNWFISVGGNRNDFAGFYDGRHGKDYLINDGQRGHSWLPKEQLGGNALIGYTKDNLRIFYKFDFFNENVDFFNPVVIPQDNYPFPDTYYSNDRRYNSNRYYHHLNVTGKLFSQLTYNASVSHQKQARDVERFNYDLDLQHESMNLRETYQSKEVFYSVGTVGDFFADKSVDFQLGYELSHENGFYDATAGSFRDDLQQVRDIRKRLANFDVYTAAEVHLTSRFSVRPGLRCSFQSEFEDQYASSLGLKYLLPHGLEIRAALGESYRIPNFEELYTYFVDSNHNLQGNDGLLPETSSSYELSVRKSTFYKSGVKLSNNFVITFLDVDDRISLVLEQVTPMQAYRYLNIDKYKMWNIATSHELTLKNWHARVGAAFVGISQKIDLAALGISSDDKFLYSLQLNSNVSYEIAK
ncbi:MAG TPA: TonB-dependent receptor, partial [Flavobacterium sp.]